MTNLRLLHYAQQCLIKSHSFACTLGHSSTVPSLQFGVFLGRAKAACYWWVFVLLRPAAIFSLSMTRIEVKPLFYISFRYGPPNMVAASSHAQPQVYMKSSILFSKQVTKATSVKRHKATFLPRGGNFLGQRNIRIFSKCWLRSPCILGRT